MVVLVVTWDGIALLIGVLALLYSLYIRDLIFQRKVHREIDLRPRTTHPAQRFIERVQSLLWLFMIAHWCFVALAPKSSLHGALLFTPSIFISFPAIAFLLLFFFLLNHARSTLESFSSWRHGALEAERTELVTDSIYFFCRHPFSLFSLLEAASLWLLAPHASSLVLLAFLALVTHVENLFEEDVLLRQHPAEYTRYMKQVHRYWPGALERS